MATTTAPLAGQSIEKPIPDTKVPKSSAAPTEAVQAVTGGVATPVIDSSATSAPAPAMPGDPTVGEPAPAPTPDELPPGFQEAPAGLVLEDERAAGFQDATGMNLQILPSYADGTTVATAINKSPLDPLDRLRLSAGNKQGVLSFLKQRYDMAEVDKHGNYVVQTGGAWYKVDPNGLGDGDAWTRTKEILSDAADVGGALLPLAGSLAGGALGAGVASVPAAGIGGATGEALRSSLGRLVGTYEATPEEQVKDIGWEGLLAMGGQTIALGAKPVIGMAKSAFNAINQYATNYGKEMASNTFSTFVKQPRWAIRRAMDAPDAIIEKTADTLKKLGPDVSPTLGVDIVADTQVDIVTSMARDSKAALQSNYKQDLNKILDIVPDTYVADVRTMVNDAKLGLVEAGYGKIVGQSGNGKFVPLSTAEIAERLGAPESQLPKIIGPDTKAAIDKISGILNDYAQFDKLKGKVGASKTVELKRALGETFDELLTGDVSASIKNVVAQTKSSIETAIGKTFAVHNAGEEYIKMNTKYATYKDAVDMLNTAVNSKNPSAIDNLIKQLVSKAGSYKSIKGEAQSLAEILPDGAKRMESLIDWEASKAFLDFVPKSTSDSGSLILKAVGLGTQMSNPRALGKYIQYGGKTLDFLKGMGPRQLSTLLSNDQAMQALFSIPLQAAAAEDQAQAALTRQGVGQ